MGVAAMCVYRTRASRQLDMPIIATAAEGGVVEVIAYLLDLGVDIESRDDVRTRGWCDRLSFSGRRCLSRRRRDIWLL